MPVRPKPMSYKCPNCNWQITTHPNSDALAPGDYYDECPHCQCKELEVAQASWMEVIRKQFRGPINQ